ncbi:MAG: helix-turn-helix domain-containing protein, partial [Cyanobacteria bacterium J06659_2]
MGRPFILDIKESEAELKKRLNHARHSSQTEKLQMLWWIKTGQVSQHQEVAQRLGRDTSTITRWLQRYRQNGLGALLAIHTAPGTPPSLTQEVLDSLKDALNRPEGFSSYGEIVEWLNQEHGLDLKYGNVYNWVRYRLVANFNVASPKRFQQEQKEI